MRKFKLEITLDNDAFYPDANPEIVEVLKKAIEKLEQGRTASPLFDTNGNRVGGFEILGKKL